MKSDIVSLRRDHDVRVVSIINCYHVITVLIKFMGM